MFLKTGKIFSLGHLIIPLVLVSLYSDIPSGQRSIVLGLTLISGLWALFLIWHSFFRLNKTMFSRKDSFWFFVLVDFFLLAAIYSIPQWEGNQPMLLTLFILPIYAFELGTLHATAMSVFGLADLYIFHRYQHMSLLTADFLVILIGMYLLIFFIGYRTDTLNRLAYYDPLTGFPNRFLFMERLRIILNQRKKSRNLSGILLLDLDQFKYVNDTMGHIVGDLLLKMVGERIRYCLPEKAMLARMGGDEFIVLLPHMKHSDEAASAAENIIEVMKQSFPLANQEIFVTTSTGISVFPDDGNDLDTLMKNAEKAMYLSKDLGRNTYQFHTPSSHTKGIQRLQMETMLRHALERDEFVVYYQPRLDTHTDELVCVEALVRWKHPELGMISPADFIPLAEDTGLIIQIGERVLYKACAQRQQWTQDGLHPFRVSVNLSAIQFRQADLPEIIDNVLKRTGLSPDLLEIEITETSAMQDVGFAILMLRVLKEMNLKIAIDDFGTGYSSLSYLRRFPIDIIKIDRLFINGIEEDSDEAAIVRAIIALAHTLKLDVTAEGVETSSQYDFLKRENCNELQGFLIGKPMSAEMLEEWYWYEKAASDIG